MLIFCLLLNTFYCQAGSYFLVESGQGEIYTRFKNALSVQLAKEGNDNNLSTGNINVLKTQAAANQLRNYDAIISVGIEASIAVSKLKANTTILMALIPKETYVKLSNTGDIQCLVKNCRVLYLDQPVRRQLTLLKLAFPDANRIAVIGSSDSDQLLNEFTRAATKLDLIVNTIKVSDNESALSAINQGLSDSDVLLAIPDPVVYNRNTARTILLSTFYRHIPLFAYSRSFVRAGATLAIYSTPEDIARHVTEILAKNKNMAPVKQNLYPKYYTIDVNQRAADALGIVLPDIQMLRQRLKAYEKQ